MLFIQDKVVKLGGKTLCGQVQSVEISAEAGIDDVEQKNGKVRKNQPTGYEASKVSIEILLEDTEGKKTIEMIREMQRLFKKEKQKRAKLLRIVNEDCAARGISTVYFKSFTSTNVISESRRTAMLELLAPKIAGIQVKKKKAQGAKKAKTRKGTDGKTIKSKEKSPAQDTRKTAQGAKRAKSLVK